MPSFLLDPLLDEDTSSDLADELSDAGYDVERVVDIPELGDGVDDSEVCEYATDTDRVILTHDQGIFKRYQGERGPTRVLWITDQQGFRPDEKAQMVRNAASVLAEFADPQDQPKAIPLTAEYLN
jgi:predicted nuclease of predicted toxin-antitoxin system